MTTPDDVLGVGLEIVWTVERTVVIWLTTVAGGVDVVMVMTFPVAELGGLVEVEPV